MDGDAYQQLQAKLVALWPTIRSLSDEEQTIVVVPSISMVDLAEDLVPLLPAYEERYLFLLLLLRQRRANVVYVTSQPVLPRLVDYYLSLIPDVDLADARRRLSMVSVGDPTFRPLSAKLLDRPEILERLRGLVVDVDRAHLVPFTTSSLEAALAVELGIPMYGADPSLLDFGSKSGSRRVFDAVGVQHPRGFENLRSLEEVAGALADLPAAEAVIKLNHGIGGLGNAIVHGADERHVAALVDLLRTQGVDPALVEKEGAIVEERIVGDELRSPSAQLRVTPEGDVELLSTHDQLLDHERAQDYIGCRFPADPAYVDAITDASRRVGRHLADAGVLGRFAIDFVAVRRATREWDTYAIEINLRKGGTTHPFLTMQLLTDGSYDAGTGTFTTSAGAARCYIAVDHLHEPGFERLVADDVLDLAARDAALQWDHARQVGVVFHMLSALPVAGRVGLTAIAETSAAADALYEGVRDRLLAVCGP
jgi:hypothetical protein